MMRVAQLGVLFIALGSVAGAQNALVVLTRPVRAKALSGVVMDPSGAVVAHAMVKVIDCPVGRPDRRTLSTVETDAKGEFLFDRSELVKPYCLHLSAPGFNPLEVEVKLSPFAGRMYLKMQVAT